MNLEYFLAVAEEMNFTQASKRLHIAQQSLSGYIARLEGNLGAKLFDRTHPMTLTPEGQCLLRYAKQFRLLHDDLKRELQDVKDCKNGELTLGITQGRGAIYLPVLVPRFRTKYPRIKLNLLEANSAQIEQALREGRVDLIIGVEPKNPRSITFQMVWEEEYAIIVPRRFLNDLSTQSQDRLVRTPELVTLKDLETCPFLSVQSDLHVGAVFWHCCAKSNMSPHIILEVRNINTALELCMRGMGAFVCPKVFLYPYLSPPVLRKSELLLFSLHYSDRIYASYLTQKYMSYAVKKFIEIVHELGIGLPNMLQEILTPASA